MLQSARKIAAQQQNMTKKRLFASFIPHNAYISAMPKQKNTLASAAKSEISPDNDISPDINAIAERYLDLWLDNLRCWSSDPEAMTKWLEESAKPGKPAVKNKP